MAVKEDTKKAAIKRYLSNDNLTKEALMDLSTREYLIITRADKGKATVL